MIDIFTIKPLLKIIADVAHGIMYLIVSKQGRTEAKNSNYNRTLHVLWFGTLSNYLLSKKKNCQMVMSRQRDV